VPEPLPQAIELSRAGVEALVGSLAQPRYRADQVLSWIHGRGVFDPAAMTDLPRPLRQTLRDRWAAAPDSRVTAVAVSADGTTRIDLALDDGNCTQTVLIPEVDDEEQDEDGGDDSFTQCLST
jgi:23S rRNA (adenine2503-C2)-methyltransferase